MVTTTGEALRALDASLKATNVLSEDYRKHVYGWASKIAEVAHDDGRKKGRLETLSDATGALKEAGMEDAARLLTERFLGR